MLGRGNTTIADERERGAVWAHLYVVEESSDETSVRGVIYPWGNGVFPLVARGSRGSEPRCASLAEWNAMLPDLFQEGHRRGDDLLYVIARCRRLEQPLSRADIGKLRDSGLSSRADTSHGYWLNRILGKDQPTNPFEQWVPYKWIVQRDTEIMGVLYVWETPDSAPPSAGIANLPAYPDAHLQVPGYSLERCGRTGEAWWTNGSIAAAMPPAGAFDFVPAQEERADVPSPIDVLSGAAANGGSVAGRLAVAACTYYRVKALSKAAA